MLREVCRQLLLGVAEHVGKVRAHREVGDIVERREDRGLIELRDAREHQEAEIAHVGLQLDVKLRQRRPDLFGQTDIPGQRMRNRRIVFVDQHHQRAVRPVKFPQRVLKDLLCRPTVFRDAVQTGILHGIADLEAEILPKSLPRIHRNIRKVKAQHPVGFPVIIGGGDGEPLKEVTPPLKDALQRREHQRLAEAAGTGEKEEAITRIGHQAVKPRGLVHVEPAVLPQFGKDVGAPGNRLHDGQYSTLPLRGGAMRAPGGMRLSGGGIGSRPGRALSDITALRTDNPAPSSLRSSPRPRESLRRPAAGEAMRAYGARNQSATMPVRWREKVRMRGVPSAASTVRRKASATVSGKC